MTRSSQKSSAGYSRGSSRKPLTIMDVLTKLPDDNVSKEAARCMLGHGQVKLGNYTIGLHEADRPLDVKKIQGRMLTYGSRQHRMFGRQPSIDQLELAGAAA